VKALPLADGRFVPCALWLNRVYPGGEVILRGMNDSQAPFDRLVAAGDTPRFSALANKQSLRQAFLDWLQTEHQTTVVAP
jgi:CRISPR-associated protein Cmr1